jgi:hypothetical protein
LLTGTFQLILHKQHTLQRTPLKRLNSPWLETPTEYSLHGFSCGQPAKPRLPRWRAGRWCPAPTVGYWTAI